VESVQLRFTSGHMGAHEAGDTDGRQSPAVNAREAGGTAADPQAERDGTAGSAANPGHAERDGTAGSAANPGHAGDASRTGDAETAGGVFRVVIASYLKFKGLPEGAGQPGNAEQGKKPVPVPPMQMIGANLDVRV